MIKPRMKAGLTITFYFNLLATSFISANLVFTSAIFAQSSKELDFMFYNVENLFDAKHDEGKLDFTFTPIGTPGKEEYCQSLTNPNYKAECYVDWNEARYQEKLDQLAKAIKLGRNQLPDFLGLVEIENRATVEGLAKKLGYKLVRGGRNNPAENVLVANSPDERGIEVALVYKATPDIVFDSVKEHVIDLVSINLKPTRNILEAKFKVFDDYNLYVFVLHWPSPAGGERSLNGRFRAASTLLQAVKNVKLENPRNHILVMGDFNVLKTDRPHPIYDTFTVARGGIDLFDVHDLYMRNRRIPNTEKYNLPLGTIFYPPEMSWDRFDRFLVSDNLEAGYIAECQQGLAIKTDSYKIHIPDEITEDFVSEFQGPHMGSIMRKVPQRFRVIPEDNGIVGYSDHFAINTKLWVSPHTPNEEDCSGWKKYGYDN